MAPCKHTFHDRDPSQSLFSQCSLLSVIKHNLPRWVMMCVRSVGETKKRGKTSSESGTASFDGFQNSKSETVQRNKTWRIIVFPIVTCHCSCCVIHLPTSILIVLWMIPISWMQCTVLILLFPELS